MGRKAEKGRTKGGAVGPGGREVWQQRAGLSLRDKDWPDSVARRARLQVGVCVRPSPETFFSVYGWSKR